MTYQPGDEYVRTPQGDRFHAIAIGVLMVVFWAMVLWACLQ